MRAETGAAVIIPNDHDANGPVDAFRQTGCIECRPGGIQGHEFFRHGQVGSDDGIDRHFEASFLGCGQRTLEAPLGFWGCGRLAHDATADERPADGLTEPARPFIF